MAPCPPSQSTTFSLAKAVELWKKASKDTALAMERPFQAKMDRDMFYLIGLEETIARARAPKPYSVWAYADAHRQMAQQESADPKECLGKPTKM